MMRKISGITEIILEKQSAKGEKMRKRILSLTLSFAVLLSSMSMSAVSVSSANVEETAGTQLQTILLDNDGKNLWVTESCAHRHEPAKWHSDQGWHDHCEDEWRCSEANGNPDSAC